MKARTEQLFCLVLPANTSRVVYKLKQVVAVDELKT